METDPKISKATNNQNKKKINPSCNLFTVFVSGLNYKTKREVIQYIFSQCGEIEYISMNNYNNQLDKNVGFCHIIFKDIYGYFNALKNLNGVILDGRVLEVVPAKVSNKVKRIVDLIDKGLVKNKTLFIRNVPPDAQEEEMKELFKFAGEISGIRMPIDKNDPTKKKGICFIDFVHLSSIKKSFEIDGY